MNALQLSIGAQARIHRERWLITPQLLDLGTWGPGVGELNDPSVVTGSGRGPRQPAFGFLNELGKPYGTA